MKLTLTILCTLACLLLFNPESNAQSDEVNVALADAGATVAYPLSVMSIINNKCYGCHSPEAKGDKSKEALQWIELQTMDPVDLLSTLDEVMEVLEEGKMPPEKMVEKYPDLKLTDDEVAKLKTWAESTMTKLDE